MRLTDKQSGAHGSSDLLGIAFHKGTDIENSSNRFEIADELGVSLGEVKKLKEKLNRS